MSAFVLAGGVRWTRPGLVSRRFQLARCASTVRMSEVSETVLSERGYKAGDRVILFDGVCNMCNAGVNMVMSLDKKDQFKFASLQGDVGQALAKKFNCPNDISTMIYVDGSKAYERSDAVLRIGERLKLIGIPAWLLLLTVPKPMRDWFYVNVMAKYRYDLFGKRSSCRLPTESERAKFLDIPA
ncbi:hypothetical protein NDN08_007473 [Rhodosorus marinus]|uniref:Thiol-disulfide oxidoreductase DCC n=1 Tax=Rhodosorus marinus TaxID=101924 RepID=A0AAV8UZ69_9RHOD|nr:hypothetical protein NDN08_007473 [Rhodosorus marinus]